MKRNKAPAKIILFGEHSIVYPDHTAILSTIDMNVECVVTKSNSNEKIIRLVSKYQNSKNKLDINISIAKINYAQALKIRKEFLVSNDISKLSDFINIDWGGYYVLIGKIGTLIDLPGMNIELKINIPIGSGMGSSAAITASIIKAIYTELEEPLTNESLFEITKEIEDFQHGRSSGADPSCVINGGIIKYSHNLNGSKEFKSITPKVGWDDNLVLINSGKPKETTGEMVSKVRINSKKFEKIFQKINTISNRFALNKYDDIAELINENGLLLEQIGVVNNKVINFSKEIREKGGAIKVVGAGGLGESGSGILLCKIKDQKTLDILLKEFNFSKIETKLGVDGVK
jgi:mevalonate kinase